MLPTTSQITNGNTNSNSISDLLHLVQERNWIPILLQWLNGMDRPAVQMEALLALTNIAELCATSYKFSGNNNNNNSSVPFPPLSFSQSLSPEALSAFHSSLSSTIHHTSKLAATSNSNNHNKSSSPSSGPVPLPTVPQSCFPQPLSASSQHLLLRHADAIPTLISLLNEDNPLVYEQALYILGSLVAGDDKAREIVLAKGIWGPLLKCLEKHSTNIPIQRLGSWCLSNLSEGMLPSSSSSSSSSNSNRTGATSNNNINDNHDNHKHGNSSNNAAHKVINEEEQVLQLVQRWLQGTTDAEILSYACWTLSHWCDGPSPQIACVINQNTIVPRLVELLTHKVWRVTKPALRTIGNIVCAEGTEGDYTQVILEQQAVPKLTQLISHSNRDIQKEACWTLSNIAAGTVDQIQAVLEAGAIPPLVQLVSSEQDPEVRSEACWVVLNATSCGSDSQIDWLVQEGCVSVLGVLLEEASMVMMALEGLERVLQVEESHCRNASDTSQPLVPSALIERALEGQSSAVTKRASRIWNQHFVSCALCQSSFSKHFSETNFCEECKCHVCLNCNCQIYHLSYQEELWAATEAETEMSNGNKKKKKSRKAKKKEKQQKQLQQKQQQEEEQQLQEEQQKEKEQHEQEQNNSKEETPSPDSSSGKNDKNEDVKEEEEEATSKERHPPVDFVSYLQQTNSIIALAKLMDALEYGNEEDIDLDALAPHTVSSSS